MHLSTKGRLAITAMVDLALREDSSPVSLAAISKRQRVSLSYLEQLFGRLRRRQIVQSRRGPRGGYSLGRDAEQITVADIVLAVDEPSPGSEDGHRPAGADAGRVLVDELWSRINEKVIEHMQAISLRELADAQRRAGDSPDRPQITPRIPQAPVIKPKRPLGPNSVFALGR